MKVQLKAAPSMAWQIMHSSDVCILPMSGSTLYAMKARKVRSFRLPPLSLTDGNLIPFSPAHI